MDSKSVKNRKLKILIMSAPIGSGHRMAAAALEEALLRLENVEVVQGNVFDFFPSWLGNAFLNFYGNVLKFCPSLYAFSYRWSNQGGGSLWMRNFINSVLLYLGKGFISGEKPDVVFSTHATPTGILSQYKQKYDTGLRLGVVVTDYTVHRWLVCPDVDAYFVADEKLSGQIGENGKVFATGIPVRSSFTEQSEPAAVRQEVRKSFGWPADAFVCLLAGGGGGMLPMEDILGSLCSKKYENIHVVAVTGHNDGLRKKLETLQNRFSDNNSECVSRLAVLGFTDSMPQLMQAADVVITKAGGVSLAECLACGANILIYHPLPGQEQGNTAFLQKECRVAAVTDLRQLDDFLEHEMKVPFKERLHRQEERQQQYGHPDAAKRIAELTEKLCKFKTI